MADLPANTSTRHCSIDDGEHRCRCGVEVLPTFAFDPESALRELNSFDTWIAGGNTFAERASIQPQLHGRHHLCALLGKVYGSLGCPDRLAYELSLDGYQPDFAVGCSRSRRLLLVELEGVDAKSFFNRHGSKVKPEKRPRLSARMLEGFGQLVDWRAHLEANSQKFSEWFSFDPGQEGVTYLMLIGKRPVLTPENPLDKDRYLSMSNMFRESGFLIRTYDDLLRDWQRHAALTG